MRTGPYKRIGASNINSGAAWYDRAISEASSSMPAGYATAWLPQTVPVACLGVNHMHWPISKPQFGGDGNPIPRPAWTPDGLRWHLVNAFDHATLNYFCLAPSLSVTTVADVYASAPQAWATFDIVALAWKDTGILFQIDATPTANARPHHNTVGYLALNANRVNPDGYLMAGGRMSVPADFGHFRLFVRAVIERCQSLGVKLIGMQVCNEPQFTGQFKVQSITIGDSLTHKIYGPLMTWGDPFIGVGSEVYFASPSYSVGSTPTGLMLGTDVNRLRPPYYCSEVGNDGTRYWYRIKKRFKTTDDFGDTYDNSSLTDFTFSDAGTAELRMHRGSSFCASLPHELAEWNWHLYDEVKLRDASILVVSPMITRKNYTEFVRLVLNEDVYTGSTDLGPGAGAGKVLKGKSRDFYDVISIGYYNALIDPVMDRLDELGAALPGVGSMSQFGSIDHPSSGLLAAVKTVYAEYGMTFDSKPLWLAEMGWDFGVTGSGSQFHAMGKVSGQEASYPTVFDSRAEQRQTNHLWRVCAMLFACGVKRIIPWQYGDKQYFLGRLGPFEAPYLDAVLRVIADDFGGKTIVAVRRRVDQRLYVAFSDGTWVER